MLDLDWDELIRKLKGPLLRGQVVGRDHEGLLTVGLLGDVQFNGRSPVVLVLDWIAVQKHGGQWRVIHDKQRAYYGISWLSDAQEPRLNPDGSVTVGVEQAGSITIHPPCQEIVDIAVIPGL